MAWIVRQENTELGIVFDIPGSELTEQKAFDKAKDEFLKWLRDSWNWNRNNPRPSSPLGGDANGPAPGGRFKVLYDTRVPGNYFINARWDYQIGLTDRETNDAYWRVVEV